MLQRCAGAGAGRERQPPLATPSLPGGSRVPALGSGSRLQRGLCLTVCCGSSNGGRGGFPSSASGCWRRRLAGRGRHPHDASSVRLATSSVALTSALATAAPARPVRGAAVVVCMAKKGGRRSSKLDTAAPVPSAPPAGGASLAVGPAPSAASSPVPAPNPGAAASGGGSGGTAAAASSSSSASTAVAVATRSLDGSDSDYETGSSHSVGGNIVPFARRQPRALVLDCAYRPINVLTWYKAFHFDYFGKGEVLEYYPPPAVCTTGAGEHPLPAVLRVPQYTADMQDLCSRVACTRRNIMVRDGFCCQYCGSRRDLTLDHVHPVSKGGKETWENLVTACMRCNQKKSDRTLRELGWKLRRQPKEPTPYEIGIVAGIATSDILRPPPEWDAYIAPYRERLEMYRKAAVEAGLVNLMEEDY